MEEIIKSLEKITQEELEKCEKNKTIPSSDVLDIVKLVMNYHFVQSNV